jgi:hypothetical protein
MQSVENELTIQHYKSQESPVSMVTRYELYDQGSIPKRGKRFFSTASRAALEPTQHPIQWVPGTPSQEVKWLGLEDDPLTSI